MELFFVSLDLGVVVSELAGISFGVVGGLEVAFVAKEVFAEVSKAGVANSFTLMSFCAFS